MVQGAVYWRLHRGPRAKAWALQMNQPVCWGDRAGPGRGERAPPSPPTATEGTGEKEQV